MTDFTDGRCDLWSWNINGINACVNKGEFQNFFEELKTDNFGNCADSARASSRFPMENRQAIALDANVKLGEIENFLNNLLSWAETPSATTF